MHLVHSGYVSDFLLSRKSLMSLTLCLIFTKYVSPYQVLLHGTWRFVLHRRRYNWLPHRHVFLQFPILKSTNVVMLNVFVVRILTKQRVYSVWNIFLVKMWLLMHSESIWEVSHNMPFSLCLYLLQQKFQFFGYYSLTSWSCWVSTFVAGYFPFSFKAKLLAKR
jgi:hypothetical protein